MIGWDIPVYIDYPKALNLSNLIKATLLTMRYVEEGIPTIPLLKGGDSSEIAFHGEWLKKLGFRRVGLHATEYVLARSRRGAEVPETPIYDMVLGKDDCLAVVGDLHIGIPQSLWLPCLRRLKKVHPTHLVLLGDVLDFIKGKPKASHVVGFLNLLKNLGAT